MLAVNLKTPKDVRLDIAAKARTRRLALNISQRELAERSGVSLGSVKRFEAEGLISLSSLLEVALVLGRLDDFGRLFSAPETPASLFAPEPKKRLRGGRRKA
jgi:transcriptional regulator with XRE-family HTH domain